MEELCKPEGDTSAPDTGAAQPPSEQCQPEGGTSVPVQAPSEPSVEKLRRYVTQVAEYAAILKDMRDDEVEDYLGSCSPTDPAVRTR